MSVVLVEMNTRWFHLCGCVAYCREMLPSDVGEVSVSVQLSTGRGSASVRPQSVAVPGHVRQLVCAARLPCLVEHLRSPAVRHHRWALLLRRRRIQRCVSRCVSIVSAIFVLWHCLLVVMNLTGVKLHVVESCLSPQSAPSSLAAAKPRLVWHPGTGWPRLSPGCPLVMQSHGI